MNGGIKLLLVALLTAAAELAAVPLEISYGGRLTDNGGAAIAGPVNLRVTFWNHATAGAVGNQIFNPMNRLRDSAGTLQAVADTLQGVALSNGVFQMSLYLNAADFHTLFPNTATAPWIQVEQVTVGGGIVTSVIQAFPRQKFASVPYALKVPVDGAYATFNASGQLTGGSGTTLQTVYLADAGASTTSTTFVPAMAAITITPRSAASHLILECSFQGKAEIFTEANSAAIYRLYETTSTPTALTSNHVLSGALSSAGARVTAPVTIRHRLSNGALTARSFKLYLAYSSAINVSTAHANDILCSVTEIAN